MPLTLAVLQIVGGVLYLLMGGDLLVRGAMALARTARISPIVVGLTVVALGTSAPELVVTLQAAIGGYPEIAIANVIGSNIANVLLVMSVPALIYPMACDQPSARVDAVFMLVVMGVFYVMCLDGVISRSDGFLLLAGLVLFLAMQARTEWASDPGPGGRGDLPMILGLPTKRGTIALLILAGIIMLPVGADLLIDGAIGLGESFGIPNQVMGLTVIAVSTSVPELATTLVAAWKRQADVAVGNVIGSNILNILGITGAASLASLRELEVSSHFLTLDIPLMFASAAILTIVLFRKAAIGQRLGGAMLGLYLMYIFLLVSARV